MAWVPAAQLPQPSALLEPCRIRIRPLLGPPEGIDVTDVLTLAIVQELKRRYGGNETLNRIEAEGLLQDAWQRR